MRKTINQEITDAMAAAKRLPWIEEENRKLKKENKILKFNLLPDKEKEWAERAFRVIYWSRCVDYSYDDFMCNYMDKKEFDESLPFDD